eukprot:TRINITY_DN21958_c1_g1_i6.p2 TRINITY_DN21958_c1_g1~~TRINITY_DN21958_c1_g1_i6.p2  ORF type:complete len:102 (-),score=2.29 TRINITY_DN21958_c1_g1_i6:10-315(-)
MISAMSLQSVTISNWVQSFRHMLCTKARRLVGEASDPASRLNGGTCPTISARKQRIANLSSRESPENAAAWCRRGCCSAMDIVNKNFLACMRELTAHRKIV